MTKETISRYLENGCKGHKNVVSSRELERALGISGNELRGTSTACGEALCRSQQISGGITMRRRRQRSMPPSEALRKCAAG